MSVLYQIDVDEFLVFYPLTSSRKPKNMNIRVFNKETNKFEDDKLSISKNVEATSVKINFNELYSGNIHHKVLAKIYSKMKEEILKGIIKNKEKPIIRDKHLKTKLICYIPKNYGNIRFISNKETISDLKPVKFDLFNAFILWFKQFEDVIKAAGIIKDDDIDIIVSTGEISFVYIEDFNKRKLVFQIIEVC